MKRKEYEDKYDSFSNLYISSPSSKSRRLNPEVFPYASEVPVSCTVPEIVEPLRQEPHSTIPTESFGGDFSRANDERAIVLYNPQTNPPLYKSPNPSLSDFSVVVDADLVAGLKGKFEQFLGLEKPNRLMEREDSNEMALVPWVPRRAGPVSPPPLPVESDEVEMMDVENDGSTPGPTSTAELGGGLQPHWQQQYCSRPELFHSNTYSPVAW